MLKSYLLVFFVSMVPLIELRGAIPIGLGMGLPILPTYLVCVVGNMIPVPFIYLFARKFLIWGYHKPLIGPICKFCIVKGEKGGRALEAKAGRGLVVALLLFVGIPLPGTGAWTGTLAGSILDMKFKDVVKACMGGVLLAGIIVGAIFIIKGCKKDDAPADDAQNTNQPVDNVGDTTTPDNVIVDDELLTLVNPWNPLPDDWTVDLVTLDDGHRVDSRCYEAYMEMINACKAAGYSPVNCSSYRAQETQQSLYDNKVQRLISSGMSEEEAKTEAAKAVAIPGTSEHQLGLAVDLVDANMQDLTSAQESTETQKWLMANSWRYGFIHRYPNGKTDITGIIYEPWHYRYVGKAAAQEIFNRDITLEEYLGKTEH